MDAQGSTLSGLSTSSIAEASISTILSANLQTPVAPSTEAGLPPSLDLISYVNDGISLFAAKRFQGVATARDHHNAGKQLRLFARHLEATGVAAALTDFARNQVGKVSSPLSLAPDTAAASFEEVKRYFPGLTKEQYGVSDETVTVPVHEVRGALERIASAGFAKTYWDLSKSFLEVKATDQFLSYNAPRDSTPHRYSVSDLVFDLRNKPRAKMACTLVPTTKRSPDVCKSIANDIRILLELATAVGCAVVAIGGSLTIVGGILVAAVCAGIIAAIEKLDDKVKGRCDAIK